MSIIFKTEERRVIPRLRSFDLAVSTGELGLNDTNNTNFGLNYQIAFIEDQINTWKNNKNLSFAGDILGSASVLGVEDQFKDVAYFIADHASNESDPLTRLALKLIRPTESLSPVPTEHPVLQKSEIDLRRTALAYFRHVLKQEPKNPIAWMELGRLYALEGHLEKANDAVKNALFLDKNNRFIVRSASRFYHHFANDVEKSLYVIRKAEYHKSDPWLISADIAYSQIMDRFSRMIKVGEDMVKARNKDVFSISELNSALGTAEFRNGHTKDAKKYFRQALLLPTDNSLAQVNWIAEKINGFDVETLKYQIPLAFEAKSIYYYEQGNFQEAYNQIIKWHDDEPFSVSPIKAASYIAGFYHKNYKTSISLTEKGLKINPNDVVLMNNLVYYLTRDGQIEQASNLFNRTLYKVLENPESYDISEQLYCSATAGLLFYKENQPELGKTYYLKAIETAKKIKNSYMISLATVNYINEALMFSDDTESEALIKQLKDTCKNSTEADIKYIVDEVLVAYEARKTNDVISK